MADLPELNQHDRPTGTIESTAFCINWLQRAIDAVLAEFPWGGQVSSATGTLSSLNQVNAAPTDMVRDVRNGFVLDLGGATKRLLRRNFSDVLSHQIKHDQGGSPATGQPSMYAFTARTLRVDVTPNQSFPYTLWYYALPAVLAASEIPLVPSDTALVDYLYLRCLEFARKVPAGSAMKYIREVEIPIIRGSDLGQEPESDHVPLDPQQFRGGQRGNTWDWMGKTSL
jgi:hypothetical protein